jgi:hypothetical protein
MQMLLKQCIVYFLIMCAHHEKEQRSHGYQNRTMLALTLVIMGISLVVVIILWAWFGKIGPSFSSDVLDNQQKELRQQFHLPPKKPVNPNEILIPPSLRELNTTTTIHNK